MKKIETQIGTLYVGFETRKIVNERLFVYDSNKQYIGYIYPYSLKEYKDFIKDLKEIRHITDLVDLGVCDNMIFGISEESLLNTYNNWLEEEQYDNDINYMDLEQLREYENVVGNNYFIQDYLHL